MACVESANMDELQCMLLIYGLGGAAPYLLEGAPHQAPAGSGGRGCPGQGQAADLAGCYRFTVYSWFQNSRVRHLLPVALFQYNNWKVYKISLRNTSSTILRPSDEKKDYQYGR